MKHLLKAALAAFALCCATAACAQQVNVQIDGNTVYFANAQPQYVNGRVLVPMRTVFERLGADVEWNPSTQTIRAGKGGTTIRLRIGDHIATVNGSPVHLDTPAMIIDNSTMVPIRFVSEALGAQVGWFESEMLVSIDTTGAQSAIVRNPPRRLRTVSLYTNEVVPVTLDQSLTSVDNARGDTFTATVDTGYNGTYTAMPEGSRLEGHVVACHPRSGNRPGIIDLAFDRIRFPSGRSVPIHGTPISLRDDYVIRRRGIITARQRRDDRMVWAGYGAGSGLLLGVLTRRPLEDAVLGGSLGYLVGQVDYNQRQPRNVQLTAGTEMGVRLDRDITASW